MIAAQVCSYAPGASRGRATMAECHVGARECSLAIAGARRLTAVQDLPAGSQQPVLHQLSDAVRFSASGVPQRVPTVDVTEHDDSLAGGEAVQGEEVDTAVFF